MYFQDLSPLANQNSLISAALLGVSSIFAIAAQGARWGLGVYGLVLGVPLVLIEYPSVSSRQRPRQERLYPLFRWPLIGKLYVRCILHLIMALPCLFCLPLTAPALCLLASAGLYLAATLRGESFILPGGDGGEGENRGGAAPAAYVLPADRGMSLPAQPPPTKPPLPPQLKPPSQRHHLDANGFSET